ncbi:hypothetical protein C8Q74DRAFT_130983 [Fomes fomentarius]|nr:hypothetical protein C8Q74DRAFT_130983 [Fomes fomentarius]
MYPTLVIIVSALSKASTGDNAGWTPPKSVMGDSSYVRNLRSFPLPWRPSWSTCGPNNQMGPLLRPRWHIQWTGQVLTICKGPRVSTR